MARSLGFGDGDVVQHGLPDTQTYVDWIFENLSENDSVGFDGKVIPEKLKKYNPKLHRWFILNFRHPKKL